MHEFETENLIIRLINNKDRASFNKLYTDPKIMKNIAEPLTFEFSDRMFEATLVKYSKKNFEMMIWAIYSKSEHKFLGIESLNFQYYQEGEAEAGLILDRLSHGKGNAVEALVGLIEYGFNHLSIQTIYAKCSLKNYAPQRVLRLSGFKKLVINDDDNLTYSVQKK
ncbi:GNAT family N-acetyltransferase [Shewanella olleyana]|uniref:GNAT family N-acetyltransferase n=1 Tax=Shewanella olleyana TaxID=135626 RepID=UPI00200E00B1|nr:GNAT family N-acetyltransferase [Shewanella olleyana]MCL1065729.1 GNAT family N-acetyltransferase [Shewanella olleyana]